MLQIAFLPPDALLSFVQLRQLSLNSCGLQAWPLPAQPGGMQLLLALQLRQNPGLPTLPPNAFAACPSLQSLELSGGGAACPSLQSLELSGGGRGGELLVCAV